jgi:hypothetical protein
MTPQEETKALANAIAIALGYEPIFPDQKSGQ